MLKNWISCVCLHIKRSSFECEDLLNPIQCQRLSQPEEQLTQQVSAAVAIRSVAPPAHVPHRNSTAAAAATTAPRSQPFCRTHTLNKKNPHCHLPPNPFTHIHTLFGNPPHPPSDYCFCMLCFIFNACWTPLSQVMVVQNARYVTCPLWFSFGLKKK